LVGCAVIGAGYASRATSGKSLARPPTRLSGRCREAIHIAIHVFGTAPELEDVAVPVAQLKDALTRSINRVAVRIHGGPYI
jgi:hypothetical protein